MTGTSASRNLNTADDQPTRESPVDDFRRFDRFPPELRWRLAINNTNLACAGFEMHLQWAMRNGGPQRTIGRINEIEANEIEVFAGRHRAQHGYELPHVAARATVLRYHERVLRRRR
jgi:hypothetical protein